ncbi:hypothetical protein [Mycolicibacterium llatzerense]|uniref:hypothetical protein n=1 Tax=Mycolicibacterium llatzerense TaxID=280871 RepID=UPI0008DE7601|nr:hypothetical protein [Mycolicibacterium llatzerense]
MSHNAITGRARHLGSAAGLVHCKDDNHIVSWSGPANLYLLTPALRGYTVAVVATNIHGQCDIIGLEGEGLLIDWDDIGGGRGFTTHTDALNDAGYRIV